ncbi:GNAT family N-acetyltransferase [Brevibacillus composti]|uniref:GNAT family N-acetyltransferase n=1 Tax=Brevibacillus composti TaxID=2796470 RepID=A0A7T5JND1_9BACL|nr:GNAT family protein [Brevibacillus composti]QQE73952.1 GNAT family N-acetyltransferase [Brevibacillus composti]QUO41036.1 GNAT family N-acetyltransferase [Brevibacillus composti]
MQTFENKPVRFLGGERVYLRPVELADTDLYFSMLFHPQARRLTGTQNSFTREQIHRYLDGKSKDSSSLLLLIALRDNDEVIGDIALQSIDQTNRNCNIRIAIPQPQHQSNGLGSEAMRLLLDYGFGILNLHRIELNVFSYNAQAIRAYEKVGFTQEGVQREALYYNHEYHDSILMSILAREYREKYGKPAPQA